MPRSPQQSLIPPGALPSPGLPMLVGFSGGLDSTVLLHVLAALPAVRETGLRAIHVHHGLQAHADDWARHCIEQCAALDVRLTVARVEVRRDAGLGLEGSAREARLQAFDAYLGEHEALVTAHHQDDQAETLLLRALRGSGVDGLGAMKAWSRLAGGQPQWRPLLPVSRQRLLHHALAQGLRWIEDPGNGTSVQDRDFLRNRVMPLLRERWPQASASLARSAGLAAQAGALLQEMDAQALALCATDDPQVLSVAPLLALDPARRARVLRRWIGQLGLPPLPGAGVARIETDLLHARPDAQPVFDWRGARVQRWRTLLHSGLRVAPLDPDWSVAWTGSDRLALPGGGSLSLHGAPALPWPLRVHARQGGERIRLPGRRHSHSLKHVLQSLGVPPWQRAVLPLLSDAGGELLAVADMACAAPLRAWLDQHQASLAWRHAV